jgi:DNA invertase Pin-like site-specific DNA recombinase
LPRRVTILFMSNLMDKIAAYVRVSTDGQSVEHQRESVMAYALQRGYHPSQITFYSDDGISGSSRSRKDRKGYLKLLKDMVEGKVKRVLVFESSRASRDFFDYLDFVRLCRDHEVKLEVVGKGEVGLENSQDLLMASIAAFLGQAERENISKRTRSGLALAKARGVKLGAPKGNSNRAGKVKYAPEMRLKADELRSHGLTYQAIAEELSKDFGPIDAVAVRNLIVRVRRELAAKGK